MDREDCPAIANQLYGLLQPLLRCDCSTHARRLPSDGIYFFFEKGETTPWQGLTVDRVVRVGTHRVNSRFPKRISQHYGTVRSLGGNKNGSVFRRHLGGALLRRADPSDPRLTSWISMDGPSEPSIEAWVSRTLRECFTYVWIRVPDREDRLSLERGSIALLAQYPLAKPSPSWLGRHAVDPAIQRSGLWNTHHVDAVPLTRAELELLVSMAGSAGDVP
jgi:hypothetical protein